MKSKLLLILFMAFGSITQVEAQRWNPMHPAYTDSYGANGFCWCNSTYDHGLNNVNKVWFVINGQRRQIRAICEELKKHPRYRNFRNGDIPYNDIQCGNGPANDRRPPNDDEVGCPGRTNIGPRGCQQKGPRWDVAWLSSRPIFGGGNNNPPPGGGGGNVVAFRKGNANFGLDGNNGGSNGQNVYLWSYSANNVNQQWVEISRGGNFYSYKKRNTNFCLDGGNGGKNGQSVYLWTCGNNNQNQHWKKVNVGGGKVRLEKRNSPGFSIDGGNGGSNGQDLYLWASSNGNQNQQWQLSTVGSARAGAAVNFVESDSPISVYPNPLSLSGGSLTIDIGTSNLVSKVRVLNVQGRTLYNEETTENQVELRSNIFPSAGIYLITVENEELTYSKRLSVQ